MVLVLFIIFDIYNNDINTINSVFFLYHVVQYPFFQQQQKRKTSVFDSDTFTRVTKGLFRGTFLGGLLCNRTDVFSLEQET